MSNPLLPMIGEQWIWMKTDLWIEDEDESALKYSERFKTLKLCWKAALMNAAFLSIYLVLLAAPLEQMYALVVAIHVCSSEDGTDDDINFWIDHFLLSQ